MPPPHFVTLDKKTITFFPYLPWQTFKCTVPLGIKSMPIIWGGSIWFNDMFRTMLQMRTAEHAGHHHRNFISSVIMESISVLGGVNQSWLSMACCKLILPQVYPWFFYGRNVSCHQLTSGLVVLYSSARHYVIKATWVRLNLLARSPDEIMSWSMTGRENYLNVWLPQ